MNMVNGPSLQFLEQSYMPVMGVTTRLLLNMRRGRCATGSMRQEVNNESKDRAETTDPTGARHKTGGAIFSDNYGFGTLTTVIFYRFKKVTHAILLYVVDYRKVRRN